MTPRRHETRLMNNQPVRFYKIVALSFLLLTIILLSVIVFMSSKRAVITITTKEEPIDVEVLVTVGDSSVGKKLDGFVTTTTVIVSTKGEPNGTKEEIGVAEGIVTIYNESTADQPLVATTRFLSEEGVLFRLKEGVMVRAGQSVKATIYADGEGSIGNIGPSRFTIPGLLSETKKKLIYGTSDEPTSGGIKKIGVLSSQDIAVNQDKLTNLARSEGQSKLAPLAGTYTPLYEVVSSSVEADTQVGEEVSEFNVVMTAKVVGVFYNMTAVNDLAGKELNDQVVDDTQLIEKHDDLPDVSLDNYNEDDNSAILSVHYNGLASLNPESRQLQKAAFFGKTKDEVRRYLLSLDRVHSVEVEFSPAWIQTVPHISDHVEVVIEKIR